MAENDVPVNLKIVTLGDGAVGKTALLQRFTKPEEAFRDIYVPTIFEEFKMQKTSKTGKNFHLTLIDSAGQEELREMMRVTAGGRRHLHSLLQSRPTKFFLQHQIDLAGFHQGCRIYQRVAHQTRRHFGHDKNRLDA